MSKTDTSLRLLAILRFSVPSNSSRTLNATQAYDVTSSGITLASAIGTLVDNSVAVKAERPRGVGVGLTVTAGGAYSGGDGGFGKESAELGTGVSTATVTAWKDLAGTEPFIGKCEPNVNDGCTPGFKGAATTLGFSGTATGEVITRGLSNKSKATNPNTTFYGAITVGTGDYKKWQGKYAVLKINTVTGKGVLRIYDA